MIAFWEGKQILKWFQFSCNLPWRQMQWGNLTKIKINISFFKCFGNSKRTDSNFFRKSTIKWGNFGTLGNFRVFNPLPLLNLLCVCGACHSFLLYAIRKRLCPRFSCYFFGPLPSRPWLSTCFKESLISVLHDTKNDVITLWRQVDLRFFFFSINRLLAQCFSKRKWRYKGHMWLFK